MSFATVSSAYPAPTKKILDNDQVFSPCPTAHWDPTLIFKRHTVPLESDNKTSPSTMLPMDPRPWSLIALQYRNSGAAEETVQAPPKDTVYPFGGDKYVPTRYYDAIDAENALYRLGRPAERDVFDTYTPDPNGTLTDNRFYVPRPTMRLTPMVQNMGEPAVLARIDANPCMSAELACETGGLWFNSTKQDKYKQTSGCASSKWEYVNGQNPSASNLPPIYR
jgi:hypothetical protein